MMVGCSAKKATTSSEELNAEKERIEQITKDGYIQALIEDKTKGGCGFVLKNTATGEYLLPNNLEDKYKQDGLKVWVKCRPIRPAQGVCVVGTPTTIEEIKIVE